MSTLLIILYVTRPPVNVFLLASAILILSKCQRQLSKENFKIALRHKFFSTTNPIQNMLFFLGTICNLGESLVNALFIFRRHKLVMHFHKCHILCVLLQVTLQERTNQSCLHFQSQYFLLYIKSLNNRIFFAILLKM